MIMPFDSRHMRVPMRVLCVLFIPFICVLFIPMRVL